MSDPVAAAVAALPKSDQNLIWIDCEMTGLDPEVDRLIEIAVIVTGPNLTPDRRAGARDPQELEQMARMIRGTRHAWRSGLIDKVKTSLTTEAQAEQQISSSWLSPRRKLRCRCAATASARTGASS